MGFVFCCVGWGGGVSGVFVLLLLFWLCGGFLLLFCFWHWVVVGLDFFGFFFFFWGGGGDVTEVLVRFISALLNSKAGMLHKHGACLETCIDFVLEKFVFSTTNNSTVFLTHFQLKKLTSAVLECDIFTCHFVIALFFGDVGQLQTILYS